MRINEFVSFRRATGMTQDEYAQQASISLRTFQSRESKPEEFRLCELKGIYRKADARTKARLVEAVTNFLEE